MITIITTKRWKRLLEDMQQMRGRIDSHTAAMKDLLTKLRHMEKRLNDTVAENRKLKAEIKRIKEHVHK